MAFNYNQYAESDSVKKKREEMEANSTYKPSDSVSLAKTALDNHNANRVGDWDGGNYSNALNQVIGKIQNRPAFSYDLNADALYQQYKDQYILGGRLAMQDTMAQASALTGGYGNSYASTAGNQAYQAYLQQLNNVIPELYNMAYTRYAQEGQDLKDQYNILNNQYNTEYGQYRDRMGDWNTEANRLQDIYNTEANRDYSQFSDNRDYATNAYNNERNYDYGLYSDAYNRAFANYQQGVSEAQFNKNYNLNYIKAQDTTKNNTGNGDLSNEMKTAKQSQATKDFQALTMNESEFKKRSNSVTIDGKKRRFDNYNQYIDTVLEKWYNENKLTENEVAYLKYYYGL